MSALGPLRYATLQTADAGALAQAYSRHLHLEVQHSGTVSAQAAQAADAPHWEGAPCQWLGPDGGDLWLRLVQCDGLQPPAPLRRRGWLALEVAVQEVDALAERLADSPFASIGAPANLAVSDKIRATQVVGPAGEVLYLTQIRGQVPPFALPQATRPVDGLFIAVLACTDRSATAAFCHQLGGAQPLEFQTYVGVLNREWGQPDSHQFPVATVQLAGQTLFEIDQLPQAQPVHERASGIASIAVEAQDLAALPGTWAAPPRPLDEFPWHGRRCGCLRGPDGERLELLQRA